MDSTTAKNMAVANIRRRRGYQWEETLVKRFNCLAGWTAFRLGSPSINLPDILAVNSRTGHLVVIEAKSGSGTSLSVPAEQIKRCLEWTRVFSAYDKRHVILAYKFLSKKRVGASKYRSRELREFYKVWAPRANVTERICTYDGDLYTRLDGRRRRARPAECVMPFKTMQPASILDGARIIF